MLNDSNQGSNFKWIVTIKETLTSIGKPEKNDIGDESHYLLTCPLIQADRCYLLKSFFYRRTYILKFKALLTSTNKKSSLKPFKIC